MFVLLCASVFARHLGKEGKRVHTFLFFFILSARHQPLHIAAFGFFLVDVFRSVGHHQHQGEIRRAQDAADTPACVPGYLSDQSERAMRGLVIAAL